MRIKCRMLELGLTVTDLARELEKPRNTVSLAINHTCCPKVRARVLARIGMIDEL